LRGLEPLPVRDDLKKAGILMYWIITDIGRFFRHPHLLVCVTHSPGKSEIITQLYFLFLVNHLYSPNEAISKLNLDLSQTIYYSPTEQFLICNLGNSNFVKGCVAPAYNGVKVLNGRRPRQGHSPITIFKIINANWAIKV